MIVIEKENGELQCRPVFIGHIKNNAVRRTLMILTLPLLIAVTILLNLILWIVDTVVGLFIAALKPMITAPRAVKKRWHEPRAR